MTATLDTPTAAAAAAAEYAELIPLREAAKILPCRRGGKRTHVATLYRWTDRGIRGTRLRYVQCGSVRCTTREWLDEFFGALTAASDTGPARRAATGESPPLASRTTAARARAVAQADAELARLGV